MEANLTPEATAPADLRGELASLLPAFGLRDLRKRPLGSQENREEGGKLTP